MSEELDRDEFGSKITELSQGLERDLAPIFIEMVNKEHEAGTNVMAVIGAMHTVSCCMLAKVYGMSMAASGGELEAGAREAYLKSVSDGTDHFIKHTEEVHPKMLAEALLKSLNVKWSGN